MAFATMIADRLRKRTNKNINSYNADDAYFIYEESEVLAEAQYMSNRVFGGPLLYTEAVDPKICMSTNPNESMGRTTAQTIMQNPTVVSIAPCKVQYVDALKSNGSVSNLIRMGVAGEEASIEDLENASWGTDKLLFTCKPDYNAYMNRVNLLARTMAVFMGIGDEDVLMPSGSGRSVQTGFKYKNMDWRKYQLGDNITQDGSYRYNLGEDGGSFMGKASDFFHSLVEDSSSFVLQNSGYVHFYGQNSSSYSEDNSTNVRDSAIGSAVEGLFSNDYVKDFAFVSGLSSDSQTTSMMSDILQNTGMSDNSFADIAKDASNKYLKGGHMVFPQMVDTSTYGKSMSITVKLISPSGDNISIFNNVMLPLAHMLAFSLPKQMSSNTYTYPFLIRLFTKGWMNCEMGVVTSFRVQRGGADDNQWTLGSLATEVDVTFDVTPLYNNLMVSTVTKPLSFFKNDGLQEYLGTLCGLNMKGSTGLVKLKVAKAIASTAFTDIPANVVTGLQGYLAGLVGPFINMP